MSELGDSIFDSDAPGPASPPHAVLDTTFMGVANMNDTPNSDSAERPPVSSSMHDTLLKTGMMQAAEGPGPLGTIDRFEVDRMIGTGGMGQVMLAREPVSAAWPASGR